MYVDKESKNSKWKDLTGPEKLKLFKSIKIAELFPNLRKAQEVQQLWERFKKSIKYFGLTKRPDELEIKDFTTKVVSWITLFTSAYQTWHVPPYMYVLVAHIPKFLRDIGSLSEFSQQWLQKLNDDITKAYFKALITVVKMY